ncbi:unnamed protein product, partial [Closterium sp. NIES-53]
MVEQILTQFRFLFSKVQLTPLGVDHGLTAPPSDDPFESSGPYPELVGCFMYLMTCTHLDLAFPLSVSVRFAVSGEHRPSHQSAAKRVLKYVASTSGMGLVLGGKQPAKFTGFSDLSYADCGQTYRSSQGYGFALGTGAQRDEARIVRVASEANTACIFTKALPPCDHQRFYTQLGLVPAHPHLLT